MALYQNEQTQDIVHKNEKFDGFSNLALGVFFTVSSVSIIVVMLMFIFIWQPIWSSGFKDFHTISSAINQLDKTASPASQSMPILVKEIQKMNMTLSGMMAVMQEMEGSMTTIESMTPSINRMTPNINRMAASVEQMSRITTDQLTRMTYLISRIENKMPSTNMLPFW